MIVLGYTTEIVHPGTTQKKFGIPTGSFFFFVFFFFFFFFFTILASVWVQTFRLAHTPGDEQRFSIERSRTASPGKGLHVLHDIQIIARPLGRGMGYRVVGLKSDSRSVVIIAVMCVIS